MSVPEGMQSLYDAWSLPHLPSDTLPYDSEVLTVKLRSGNVCYVHRAIWSGPESQKNLPFPMVDNKTVDMSTYPDPVVHTFIHFLYTKVYYDPSRLDPAVLGPPYYGDGLAKGIFKSDLIMGVLATMSGYQDQLLPQIFPTTTDLLRRRGPLLFLDALKEAYPREITADPELQTALTDAQKYMIVKEGQKYIDKWDRTKDYADWFWEQLNINDWYLREKMKREFQDLPNLVMGAYAKAMVKYLVIEPIGALFGRKS